MVKRPAVTPIIIMGALTTARVRALNPMTTPESIAGIQPFLRDSFPPITHSMASDIRVDITGRYIVILYANA